MKSRRQSGTAPDWPFIAGTVYAVRVDIPNSIRLTWGELLTRVLIVMAFFSMGLMGFFGLFWLSWMSFAPFVGMTPIVAVFGRSMRVLWFIAFALLTLWGIGECLKHQYVFAGSLFVNRIVDAIALICLVACVGSSRHLPQSIRYIAGAISFAALFAALVWTFLSPSQIFLPVLFMPARDMEAGRWFFLEVFGAGVVASLLIGLALVRIGIKAGAATDDVFEKNRFRRLLMEEISTAAKVRMALGFTAVLAATILVLYFIPGTCGGSGGIWIRPAYGSPESAPVTLDEVEKYLISIGCRTTSYDPQEFSRMQPAAKVFSYLEFPVSNTRFLYLAVCWNDFQKDPMVSFSFSRLSFYQMKKGRKLVEVVKQHFHVR